MGTADEILSVAERYGPPEPSLLTWTARWAAEADLPAIARTAAAQALLTPPLRWPAVADAVAEVLAERTREQPALALPLADVLPQIAAHLSLHQALALARSGIRPEALAYKAVTGPDSVLSEATRQKLDPLWADLLRPERPAVLPPLSNLRLLSKLAHDPRDPLASLKGSEVIYLLPYLTAERAAESDVGQAAVAEIEDWLEQPVPWYAAALLARAVPRLDDGRRARLASRVAAAGQGRGVAGADWSKLLEGLCRGVRSDWPSADAELSASHPAASLLEELARDADSTERARAAALLALRLSDLYGDPGLQRWEQGSSSAKIKLGFRQAPVIIIPESEGPEQVPLGVAEDTTGMGDRMQLPGISTRYRLLEFACPDSVCQSQHRVYYDGARLPACAHGQMTLQPRPMGAAP